MSNRKIEFMSKVISLQEHANILNGIMTNKPAVTIAQYTAHLIDKSTWCEAMETLLPANYGENLREELPKIYDWGLEHSHGDRFKPYDPGKEGPIPKGCTRDDKFAFFDQRLNVLKPKTAKQLATPAELLDLGTRKFWRQYAGTDRGAGFDAMAIADMLISACLDKGKFDATRIRDMGCWRDKNGKVVNNIFGAMPEQGYYTYTRFEEFETLEGTSIRPRDVLEWLQLFNWKDPNFAILVLGWLSYAPICGALKQRPHIYLTGAKNTGKTSLLVGIEALLQPLALAFDGSVTTEAGLRQKLGGNALPVMIDEFESSNPQRRERIMDLARSSYSANASGVKGTPSGKHMEFLISSTFLFSGIDFQRENAANASRMFVVELVQHNNDPDIEMKIENGQINFADTQTSWCYDRVLQAEMILEAIDLFQPYLLKINSRAKRNLSTCFGAAFVALENRLPDKKDILDWVKTYQSLIYTHEEGHEQNDAQDCLTHLLAHPLHFNRDEERMQNVWELIAVAAEIPVIMRNASNKGPLQAAGMRVDNGMLYVSDNHPALRKAYQGTRWERSGWKSQLLRLEGAIEDRAYFQGLQQRCVAIPLINLNLDHVNNRLMDKHLLPKTRQNKKKKGEGGE